MAHQWWAAVDPYVNAFDDPAARLGEKPGTGRWLRPGHGLDAGLIGEVRGRLVPL